MCQHYGNHRTRHHHFLYYNHYSNVRDDCCHNNGRTNYDSGSHHGRLHNNDCGANHPRDTDHDDRGPNDRYCCTTDHNPANSSRTRGGLHVRSVRAKNHV